MSSFKPLSKNATKPDYLMSFLLIAWLLTGCATSAPQTATPDVAAISTAAEVTASAPAMPPAQLLSRQGRGGRPNQAIFSGDSQFILVAYDFETAVFPAGETRETASLATAGRGLSGAF